jgi:hypothetical protein
VNWRIVRGTKDPISGEDLLPLGSPPAPHFDDLGFGHAYECEVRPSTAEEKDGALVFPGGTTAGRRASCECLVIRVRPESGAHWRGAFYGDNPMDASPEGVFALPCRDDLLVVTRGASFLVPTGKPTDARVVSLYTTGLVAVPDLGVLALSDHDTIQGIGPGGLTWETPRISMCCLRLRAVEGNELVGDAQDTSSRDIPFRVDLGDGSHHGGWDHTP